MSHKVKPSVQSLKSMPADYRFLGSPPLSDPLENSSSGSSVSVTIPRNGHLKNGFKGTRDSVGGVDNGNEDSPYSVSNEDPVVPLPRSTDRRWSDTSVYARKKVCLRLIFLVGPTNIRAKHSFSGTAILGPTSMW